MAKRRRRSVPLIGGGSTAVVDAEIIGRVAKPADPHVVQRDLYDAWTFKRVKATTPEVEEFCTARGKAGEVFAADVFSSLFKMEPHILEESESPHLPVIKEMWQMPAWLQFRETTRLDHLAAALGTAELAKQLADKLPKDDAGKVRGLDAPLNYPGPVQQLPEVTDAALHGLLRTAIQATAQKVEGELEAVRAMAAPGWGTSAGQAGRESVESVAKLYQRIQRSDILREVAKLAGRMKRIALRKHANRVRHAADEVVDVETGRDLMRVLPTELMLLDTDAELDFLRRYAEGGLLQYRLEGKEVKGRGPIILCLDSSGSMYCGSPTREVWAKAMALGLMTIAAKERRGFALLTFGDNVTKFTFTERPKTEDIMTALEFRYEGAGTNFDRPISEALTLVQDANSRKMRKADIVFLTDGECAVSHGVVQKLTAAKQDTGLRFLSVLIGTRSRSLEPLSDGMAFMDQVNNDGAALDLAFGV